MKHTKTLTLSLSLLLDIFTFTLVNDKVIGNLLQIFLTKISFKQLTSRLFRYH